MKSLDESRLRDVLEREFRLSAIAIVRDGPEGQIIPPTTAEPKTELDTVLLMCLSNGKPWRRKALIERASSAGSLNVIHRSLMRLERTGVIRKIRHGVFISADAAVGAEREIPPLNMDVRRPTNSKTLELLTTPRSASDLREILKVTRQRIDQILKKMIKERIVRRFEVAGEKGKFMYVLSEHFDQDVLLKRSPILRSPRERLLSSLSPQTLCRAADLSLIALSSSSKTRHYLEQLSALGLSMSFKLGQHTYIGITPRGLAHPQYDSDAPKCEPADIVADFGEARVRFVQYLELLGSARTIDLTYAMPKGYFEGKGRGSGQIIQGLEGAGIVQRAELNDRGHPLYALTDRGRFLSCIMARVNALPSAADLQRVISERHHERSELIRSASLKASRVSRTGSPNQAAIIRSLEVGPLTTPQIIAKMDTKFKNPRSVHLALQTLHRRGLIRLAGINAKKQNVWTLPAMAPAPRASAPELSTRQANPFPR